MKETFVVESVVFDSLLIPNLEKIREVLREKFNHFVSRDNVARCDEGSSWRFTTSNLPSRGIEQLRALAEFADGNTQCCAVRSVTLLLGRQGQFVYLLQSSDVVELLRLLADLSEGNLKASESASWQKLPVRAREDILQYAELY